MISNRPSSAPLPTRWWIGLILIVALVLGAGYARARLEPAVPTAQSPTASAPPSVAPTVPPRPPLPPSSRRVVASSGPVVASSRPVVASSRPAVAKDLLAMSGAPPAKGTGTFGYAPGRGRVLGTAGPVRRFRVAVEWRSGEDVRAFATAVETVLGGRLGWTGGGRLRFQRVSGAERADFTVYLATRETAGVMCARGGVNIRVGGRPYTSCRASGQAIINLDRWRLSARPYIAAKVPLEIYRQYVINHEVGHELGHGHQGCPRRGGPAPVMVQQTLTLRGCLPNAWPRRAGRDLVGPPV